MGNDWSSRTSRVQLAMALRMSLEEERARAQAAQGPGETAQCVARALTLSVIAVAAGTSATSAAGEAAGSSAPMATDDDAVSVHVCCEVSVGIGSRSSVGDVRSAHSYACWRHHCNDDDDNVKHHRVNG
jgi:hypothetical protein